MLIFFNALISKGVGYGCLSSLSYGLSGVDFFSSFHLAMKVFTTPRLRHSLSLFKPLRPWETGAVRLVAIGCPQKKILTELIRCLHGVWSASFKFVVGFLYDFWYFQQFSHGWDDGVMFVIIYE